MAEASGRGSLRAGERRHSPCIRQRRQKVLPARRCGKSQLSIAREGFLDRRSKRLSFPHFFLRRKKCGRRRPPPRQGKANSPPQRRKRALFVSDGAISRPGASAVFVSAGDSFAPRRELLLSAVTKVAKSTGRNCVSALPQRAILSCDFLRILAGIAFCRRCRIKGLCLRSPARRLTRPLASATAEIFRSYRHPLQAFPLRGPRGDRCPHIPAALAATYPLRCFAPQWARFDNRHSTSAPTPTLTAVSGSGASGTSDP